MKSRWILALLVVLLAIPASVYAVTPPHMVVGKVRVQVRVDRPHSLGICWPSPIKHLHVEIFQIMTGGRAKYLSNFHVGKSGSCYVVFNNYRPAMCYKTCNGSSGLRSSLVRAAKTVAVAFGITFTATVIAIIVATAFVPALGL
jgi:hypothetical protein